MTRINRKAIPEPTIHAVYLPGQEKAIQEAGGNHDQRRYGKLADRRLAKRTAREITVPLTEDMIPPGSLLSDETLAQIRAGNYGLARYIPPASGTPARQTYAQKLKQRQKANKLRRLNPSDH